MEDIITLVGPRATGKSTIGKEIEKITGYKYIDFDKLMNDEFKSEGGLFAYAQKNGWDVYLKKVHIYLKKLLKNLKGQKIILDLGGGVISSQFSISEKNAYLVKRHTKIILLLPDEEDDKNISILINRELERTKKGFWMGWKEKKISERVIKDYFQGILNFRKHAHHEFYSKEQSPKKVANIIIKFLKKE
jgi:shikimate kinase